MRVWIYVVSFGCLRRVHLLGCDFHWVFYGLLLIAPVLILRLGRSRFI
nr:MAG TPA: hypothetical protein [Caudoviricetes sp.]